VVVIPLLNETSPCLRELRNCKSTHNKYLAFFLCFPFVDYILPYFLIVVKHFFEIFFIFLTSGILCTFHSAGTRVKRDKYAVSVVLCL
jgi:hypothetical protein